MNILVAVDLSEASASIVAAAGTVASAMSAAVYILHVAEPDPDFVGYDAGPEVVRSQVAEEFHRDHRAVPDLSKALTDQGIESTALMIQGPTVEVTLREADRLGAALIVVGSHGHGAVYDVLVGSYSAALIRKSKLPVLVIPVRNSESATAT